MEASLNVLAHVRIARGDDPMHLLRYKLGGLITQLRSIPVGFRIDDRIAKSFPELAGLQKRAALSQLPQNLRRPPPGAHARLPKQYDASSNTHPPGPLSGAKVGHRLPDMFPNRGGTRRRIGLAPESFAMAPCGVPITTCSWVAPIPIPMPFWPPTIIVPEPDKRPPNRQPDRSPSFP